MAQYKYEPWLDPSNARYFLRPRVGPGVERKPPPSTEIPVFCLDSAGVRRCGSKKVYGLLAYLSDPIIVRVELPMETVVSGFDCWRKALERELSAVIPVVKRIFGEDYNLTPTNSSWHRLASRGANRVMVYVLFTREYRNTVAAPHVGRLGSYLGKLTSTSYELATGIQLDVGDPNRSYYKDWDGVFFIREGSLESPPGSRVVQILGVRKPDQFLQLASVGVLYPLVWGMGLIVPDRFWDAVLDGCGIPGSTGDIIAANKDHVKFAANYSADAFPIGDYSLWVAREAFVTHKAVLSQEDRQHHQMSEAALIWLREQRVREALRLREGFEALASGDRAPLVEVLGGHLEELYESARSATDDDPENEVIFNSIQGSLHALAAGAPVAAESLGELYIALLRRVQSVRVPGITAYSFPSNVVGEFGVALPRSCRRRIQVGERATDLRFPNTGTGLVPVQVAGFTPLPVVLAHPGTGKYYQNEDYDGDVSVVIFKELVRNSGWRSPVQKVKEVGDLTPTEQLIYGSFSKLAIGIVDTQLTSALLANLGEESINTVRMAIQTVVDMAKKRVETTPVETRLNTLTGDVQLPTHLLGQVIRKSSYTGARGANKVTELVRSYLNGTSNATVELPESQFHLYAAAAYLPLIEIDGNKWGRTFDAACIPPEHKGTPWAMVEEIAQNDCQSVERAFWLIFAYDMFLYHMREIELVKRGYELLKAAKALVTSRPSEYAPALRALAFMTLAYAVEGYGFINKFNGLRLFSRSLVVNDRESRVLVESIQQALEASEKSKRKPYDHCTKIPVIKSATVITTWPVVIGSYDLGRILADLGYQHQYPIRMR